MPGFPTQILLLTTFAGFVTHVWLQQNYFYFFQDEDETRPYSFFESDFILRVTVSNLLALALSVWTISEYPLVIPATMKWSIPGNALFCGGVRSQCDV